MNIDLTNVKAAHQHSSLHRKDILASKTCRCFHCLAEFSPQGIIEWIDEGEGEVGETALCPFCTVDAVLGDKSGLPLTDEFLDAMYKHWFA